MPADVFIIRPAVKSLQVTLSAEHSSSGHRREEHA
jgi:hypothetical protein